MSERTRDLFSPERLRQNWDQGDARTGAERAGAAAGGGGSIDDRHDDDDPGVLLARLDGLASSRMGGQRGEALRQMIALLAARVSERFPPAGGAEPDPKQRVALEQQMQTLLAQIEDLADALSLGAERR